jgi:glutathione S-transferase
VKSDDSNPFTLSVCTRALSALQPAERPVFWAIVREAERDTTKLAADIDNVAKLWKMLDAQLQGRFYIEGEPFTLADIVLGPYAKRWFGLQGVGRPSMPNLERAFNGSQHARVS